jgi:hypothetical protein
VTGLLLLDAALAGEWEVFRNALSHLVLPASLLGYFSLAYISRMTRSFMLNELARSTSSPPGQGAERGPHHLAPRAAQRAGAADHRGGAVLRRPAGRRGADRDRLRLAGLGLYITNSLQNADMNAVLGGTIVGGHDLHRAEPAVRPAVPVAGPAHAGHAMSDAWPGWLMSRAPVVAAAGRAGPRLRRLAGASRAIRWPWWAW